jgi:hypothetical protein
MSGIDFSTDELLAQARGNQTAIWYLAVRRARERDGSVDDWARFVAEDFAPSWDEMGEAASAIEVARGAALNMATTADMTPTDLSGDDARATVTCEGPEPEWTDEAGVTVDDLDRVNEVIFGAIAERRGLAYTQEREASSLRMTFARR